MNPLPLEIKGIDTEESSEPGQILIDARGTQIRSHSRPLRESELS